MINVEAVSDNILLIRGEKDGKFPHSHSILILDEEKVLIDTGCGIETLKRIKKEYDLSYIINSHTHPDHSAGNWVFKTKPIYVPIEVFKSSGDILTLSERFVSKKLAHVWRVFVREKMGLKAVGPHILRVLKQFLILVKQPSNLYIPLGTQRIIIVFMRKKGEYCFHLTIFDALSMVWT